MTTLVALIAAHNRREKTLACLRSFYAQRIGRDVELQAVVVDDGSTDGTSAAVRTEFGTGAGHAVEAESVLDGGDCSDDTDIADASPSRKTLVVRSSGDLFWAAGMALAERHALARDPDYLLWLNDDVTLDPDGLERMLGVERTHGSSPCVVVGALRDPVTDKLTYSGVRRRGLRLHPLRVELVQPGDRPISVWTFNGNVVLVPRAVTAVAGRIDGRYAHAFADFDYGLRAASVGVRSLLAPGTVGTCAREGRPTPWLDPSLPVRKRLQLLLGPKGFPPRSQARYLRRHGGLVWPIFWLAPYLRQTCFMIRSKSVRPAGR